MAGPKNPEQLRGALGAFRRRLQEAERPKDPVLDLQVDRGLDPSKAPVPVAPASPRFQAPMIPEEPDLPPVSSGAYKGVEDIANRVINTPTDRRSFLKGTGQAINALKFMNSPLARLAGQSTPEQAPILMSQDEALATILRDVLKESGVFEKYRYTPDVLVKNDKGVMPYDAITMGQRLSYELGNLKEGLSDPSDPIREFSRGRWTKYARESESGKRASAIIENMPQRYKELTGKDLDMSEIGKRFEDILKDLQTQGYFNVGDLTQSLDPKRAKYSYDEPGLALQQLNENLDLETYSQLTDYLTRNPSVDKETAYLDFNPGGPGYGRGTRAELKNREISRKLLDEFLPDARSRFDRVWDKAYEEAENQRRTKSGDY
jgi:hypothetical protein